MMHHVIVQDPERQHLNYSENVLEFERRGTRTAAVMHADFSELLNNGICCTTLCRALQQNPSVYVCSSSWTLIMTSMTRISCSFFSMILSGYSPIPTGLTSSCRQFLSLTLPEFPGFSDINMLFGHCTMLLTCSTSKKVSSPAHAQQYQSISIWHPVLLHRSNVLSCLVLMSMAISLFFANGCCWSQIFFAFSIC